MSYCVNCGVELDRTATACPLCRTKIYNPNQPVATDVPTPYPTVKGTTDTVKRTEFTILMSIILITTAIVCVLLNLLTIQIGKWSFYVVGICAMLWVFMLPLFFPKKTTLHTSLALDGFSISLFLALVAWMHPGNQWYPHIGLPIVILGTLLLEIIFSFSHHRKSSMIVMAAVWVAAIGIFCVATEMMIDLHLYESFYLTWSAIVLTCCVVIDIVLVTIRLREGLRAELRRRMHF